MLLNSIDYYSREIRNGYALTEIEQSQYYVCLGELFVFERSIAVEISYFKLVRFEFLTRAAL